MGEARNLSEAGRDGARRFGERLGMRSTVRRLVGAAPGSLEIKQPPRFSGRNSYSLFVGILKVTLPAFAAALVLLVLAWPQLMQEEERFRIGVSRISLDQAENLSMLNARYEGVDEGNRPFSITADQATQASADADIIDLELPKADMTLEDGTWIAISANSGRYRREAEIVDLEGDVVMYHDQGFEVRTDAATVFLKEGDARGSKPVNGQGPAGLLTSQGFHLIDQGERIIFTGKSSLLLYPEAPESVP